MIQTERKNKNAVFLDRDGTLILDKGFITNPEKVVFYNQTFDALKKLQEKFELFIISNQSSIAKGMQTLEETETVNNYIMHQLANQGINIRNLYFCPHKREDYCCCIKPKPYFAQKAAADFGISLSGSFSVGDHPHDIELAQNFGGTGIYILTGHGQKHLAEIRSNHFVAKNIIEAADLMYLKSTSTNHYCSATEAAGIIKNGGVAIIPTETVYGLGCNALNEQAAERVFKLKQRPFFDPLIVHISDMEQLSEVAQNVSKQAMLLANSFWPGPLTLIFKKNNNIPDIITGGLKTVAVRMPSHPVALKIIRDAGCPVAAPSANIFGCLSPTTAENAKKHFGDSVSCVVDGGSCDIGIESTIVDLSKAKPQLLRLGAIPIDLLNEYIGNIEVLSGSQRKPTCPGTMSSHYAPVTRLILNTPGKIWKKHNRVGRIVFGQHHSEQSECVENLSVSGDLNEAAKNLYAALSRLDRKGLDFIVADILPENGVGAAINDRLRRASIK